MLTPANTLRRTLKLLSLLVSLSGGAPGLLAADASPAANQAVIPLTGDSRLATDRLELLAMEPPAANQAVIPLAGEWRFAMDRDDAGQAAGWFNNTLADKINIPGILQAQGYGDDISMSTQWVGPLGTLSWRNNPELTRFTDPDNFKVPFLAQPMKHYLGVAWYQRDIDIPVDWSGKRIELFIERAHWRTTARIDDKAYAPE